jgi:hypothetical protein
MRFRWNSPTAAAGSIFIIIPICDPFKDFNIRYLFTISENNKVFEIILICYINRIFGANFFFYQVDFLQYFIFIIVQVLLSLEWW